MKLSSKFCTAVALAQLTLNEAFAPNVNVHTQKRVGRTSSSSVDMVPMDALDSFQSASTFISTISADIDNIPENEFATVFAGGIAVMIGGVFSTVMVGFMLESGNSYASVVADSYEQTAAGAGDEDFWDKLSPEEAEKTRELLAKIRESKEAKERSGQDTSLETEAEQKISAAFTGVGGDAAASTSTVDTKKSEKNDSGAEKKEVSMFSDYDD